MGEDIGKITCGMVATCQLLKLDFFSCDSKTAMRK